MHKITGALKFSILIVQGNKKIFEFM